MPPVLYLKQVLMQHPRDLCLFLVVLLCIIDTRVAQNDPAGQQQQPQQMASLCLTATAQQVGQSCYFSCASETALGECALLVMTNFTSCFGQEPPAKVVRIRVPHAFPSTEILKLWADGFLASTGILVQFSRDVPVLRYYDEISTEIASNVSEFRHDGWALYPSMVPSFSDTGALADLGPYIRSDLLISWTDISPLSRERLATYDRTIRGLPYDTDVYMMYYRSDILLEQNWQPPVTWEEFVSLAKQANGTDTDGDGRPNYSVCLDFAPGCTNGFKLITLAASMIQHLGSSQGVFFDPQTMEALANNVAMARAMEWLADLQSYSDPDNSLSCQTAAVHFAQGTCVLSFGWADHFKMAQLSNMSRVSNATGVAELPGSTVYLSRSTKQLLNCTRATCPYALFTQLQDGSTALVNRAPYAAAAGFVGSVSTLVGQDRQDAAYKFWSYVASPEVSMAVIAREDSPFDPFRMSHLNVLPWVQDGYNANATLQFLAATKSFLKSKNVALDLAIPGSEPAWEIMFGAVDNYLMQGGSVSSSLSSLQEGLDMLIARNPARATAMYRTYLGAPFPNTSTMQQRHAPRRGKQLVAVVVPSVLCGCVLVLAGIALYAWRLRDSRKSLFGRVIAPGSGPESTLVVTDIQDSTALWEAFPAEAMDAVLQEHHRVVRQLLVQYGGYESATEGDSFILAFHTAKDAVLFSIHLQQALLTASWPLELLQAPSCQQQQVVVGDSDLFRFHARSRMLQRQASQVDWLYPGDGIGVLKGSSSGQLAADSWAEPSIPTSNAGPSEMTGCTFKSLLLAALTPTDEEQATTRLLFRGPRVRVGIHSWTGTAASLVFNPSVQRTQYSGEALVVAKAVCDAAQGGMVLLCASTYQLLHMEDIGQQLGLLHCGCHELTHVPEPRDLYQAVLHPLAPRLALLGPVQSLRSLDLGALEAPAGITSILFMLLVGAQTLLAWNHDVARQAIAMLHALASKQLGLHHGYMVEQTDGLVLASFQSPEAAAQAALRIMAQGLHLAWPDELLLHPLGEELAFRGTTVSSRGSYIADEDAPREVLMRGLRLKAGIDTGPASASPHTTTGRITYRGRVMNRAARIASTAGTGQVLAGQDCASQLQHCTSIVTCPVGVFHLKGISRALTLHQINLRSASGRHRGSDEAKGGPFMSGQERQQS